VWPVRWSCTAPHLGIWGEFSCGLMCHNHCGWFNDIYIYIMVSYIYIGIYIYIYIYMWKWIIIEWSSCGKEIIHDIWLMMIIIIIMMLVADMVMVVVEWSAFIIMIDD
jgi:hypothetical protein